MTAPDAYPPDLARGAAGERAAFLTDAAGRVHRAVLLAFAAGGERPSRRTLIHAAGDAAAADRALHEGWERASLAVLVVRLLAAAYVANVFFRHSDDANLMYAILTVPFLIALPYEYARAKSDQEPAAFDRRPGRWQIGVYALIGLGYGTRATLGVLVAALLGADPVLLLLIFLAAALAASADTVRYWAKESAVENALEQETGETTVRAHVAPLHRYIADRSTGLSGLGR